MQVGDTAIAAATCQPVGQSHRGGGFADTTRSSHKDGGSFFQQPFHHQQIPTTSDETDGGWLGQQAWRSGPDLLVQPAPEFQGGTQAEAGILLAQIQVAAKPVLQVDAAAQIGGAVTVAGQSALAGELGLADPGTAQQFFIKCGPEPLLGFRRRIGINGHHRRDPCRQQGGGQPDHGGGAGCIPGAGAEDDQPDMVSGQQGCQRCRRDEMGFATNRRVQIVAGLESKQGRGAVGIVAEVTVQMQGQERAPGGPGVVQLLFQCRQGRGHEYPRFHQAAQATQRFQQRQRAAPVVGMAGRFGIGARAERENTQRRGSG